MSGKSVNSMRRYELEQRYKEYGCDNYKLRTLDDLKNIHGFDVMELSGYRKGNKEYYVPRRADRQERARKAQADQGQDQRRPYREIL